VFHPLSTSVRSAARLVRLGAYTAANMQRRQLLGVASRQARQFAVPRLPVDVDGLYQRELSTRGSTDAASVEADTVALRAALPASRREQYRDLVAAFLSGSVTFLGRTLEFSDPTTLDWTDDRTSSVPPLWLLKLHGFEPVSWAVLGHDEPTQLLDAAVRAWIHRWTERYSIGTPQYLRRAWTPYCVSLRVRHWSRFAAWRRRADFAQDTALLQSLEKNVRFLARNLEHDVGGNHLVENGAALVLGGALLDDAELIARGRRVLEAAADDQLLPDGGHFERSSMYHVLVLESYLTAVNVLAHRGTRPDRLTAAAQAATEFLATLEPPDSKLPLLNDAVRSQSLGLETCLRYAARVGIEPEERSSGAADAAGRPSLPDSGYYWLGDERSALLVDGGPVGPRHLPGHSHNDLLQVLWWVDGTQFVTDTGTYSYESGPRRQYARSVAAHNTVQVGDVEPIEIGGKYLMGRRTEPSVRLTETDDVTALVGSYERTSRTSASYRHCRRVYAGDAWWLVWDRVDAPKPVEVHSRLHLHPAVSVTNSAGEVVLEREGTRATASPVSVDETIVESGSYFPRFGTERQRPVLHMRKQERSVARCGVLLSSPSDVEVTVVHRGGTPRAVVVDGEHIELPNAEP